MGMDLVLAVAYQRHPERSHTELLAMIDSLTAERADEIFEDAEQIGFYELYSDAEGDGFTSLSHVQGKLREALESVQGSSYSRDVMTIPQNPSTGSGPWIALGGGSSWGDTPEGYSEVAYLEAWGEW